MSLEKKTFNALLWGLMGTGTQTVLRFLVLILIARLLGPEEFGLVSVALVVVGLAQLFTSMGVGPAIIQKAALTEVERLSSFYFSVLFGALTFTVIYLSADWISRFFNMDELSPILKLLALSFPVACVALVSESLMQSRLRFKELAIRDIASYFIGYVLIGLTLAYSGFGAWSLAWAHLIQTVVKASIILWSQPQPVFGKVCIASIYPFIRYGGGISIAKIANHFAGNGDNLVVAKLLGAADAGLYNRAFQLVSVPAGVLGGEVAKVLFASMSTIKENKEKLKRTYVLSKSLALMVSAPFAILLYFHAKDVIEMLLGAEWGAAIVPLQLLAISLPLRAAYRVDNALVNAVGAVYRRAGREIIYAVLVVVMALIGSHYGLAGVALGVSTATGANYFIMSNLSEKLIALNAKDAVWVFVKNFLVCIPSVCTLTLLSYLYDSYDVSIVSTLLVSTLSLLVVYGVTFLLCSSAFKEELMWMRRRVARNSNRLA